MGCVRAAGVQTCYYYPLASKYQYLFERYPQINPVEVRTSLWIVLA
jgi:hypothetical protein